MLMCVRLSRRAVALGFVLILAAVIGAPGCGKRTATVTGKVTYKGEPLKGGIVAFIPPRGGGTAVAADIAEDGTYTATDVLVGEVEVTVDTSNLKPPEGGRLGRG